MVIVPHSEAINAAAFDCGEPARNAWLQNRALANQQSDDTRTYAALDGAYLAGFYALTVGAIIRGGLPGPMRRNAPDPVSCVLLAQLAVSLSEQGRGVSRRLVLHAMGQATKIADLAGCRLFMVHPARPELFGYYAKFGFVPLETTPPVMVMNMQKVRATLLAVVQRQ